MDYVRSFYSTKAHFKAGDARQSTIRWYAAPPGAKPFPHRHSFGSLNWSNGSKAGNTVGEVIGAARPYSNLAGPSCSDGTTFVGSPSDFLNGISEFLVSRRAENECGQPVGCTKSAYPGVIGAKASTFSEGGCVPVQDWRLAWYKWSDTPWTFLNQGSVGGATWQYNFVFPNQYWNFYGSNGTPSGSFCLWGASESLFFGTTNETVQIAPVQSAIDPTEFIFDLSHARTPPGTGPMYVRFSPPHAEGNVGAAVGIVSSQERAAGQVGAMAASAGLAKLPLLVVGQVGARAATSATSVTDRVSGFVGAMAGTASVAGEAEMPYSGAKCLGSVNVAQNTWTNVPFTVKDWDTDGYSLMSPTAGKFVVPARSVDTYYKLTATIVWGVPPTVVCGRQFQIVQGQGWTPPSGQINYTFQNIDYEHANWGHGATTFGAVTVFVPANMTPNYQLLLYCDGGGPFAADCAFLIERL